MGRAKERFCLRGHDTDLTGRTSRRVCRECARLRKNGTIPTAHRQQLLPLEPLETVMRMRGIQANDLGVTKSRAYHRAQKYGLSVRMADELACHIGLHPVQIWGNDFYEGVPEDGLGVGNGD